MKISALILTLLMPVLYAREAYSIQWLKSGSIGFSKFSEKSDMSDQESKDALQLGVWLQGYLQAVEMLSYSSEGRINEVPPIWKNSISASESILSYINEFEKKYKIQIPDDFAAKSFVNSWYSVKHPKTKPNEAYMYEQLFLMMFFREAFDAQESSKAGEGTDQPAAAPDSKLDVRD